MTSDSDSTDSAVQTYEIDVVQGDVADREMIDWINRSLGDHLDVRDVRPATRSVPAPMEDLDPSAFLREVENGADIDHPDPEVVVQAARVASLVRATMYDVAAGEAEELTGMIWKAA